MCYRRLRSFSSAIGIVTGSLVLALCIATVWAQQPPQIEDLIKCPPIGVDPGLIYSVKIQNVSNEVRNITIQFYDRDGTVIREEPFSMNPFTIVGQGVQNTSGSSNTYAALVKTQGNANNFSASNLLKPLTGQEPIAILPCSSR